MHGFLIYVGALQLAERLRGSKFNPTLIRCVMSGTIDDMGFTLFTSLQSKRSRDKAGSSRGERMSALVWREVCKFTQLYQHMAGPFVFFGTFYTNTSTNINTAANIS